MLPWGTAREGCAWWTLLTASSKSSTASVIGSMRSAASLASSTSVRSGPAHPQRPPPAAASAGWAGIRESLDVSGIDATVGEEVRCGPPRTAPWNVPCIVPACSQGVREGMLPHISLPLCARAEAPLSGVVPSRSWRLTGRCPHRLIHSLITCPQVTAESSVRIASEPDGRPGIAPSTFASQPSASSSGQPSRVVGQELTHQFEPPHSEAGSAPPRQTFAEAADAAVAAVEAEAT